jgi:UDP-N-acetyl-D-mannosaminuronate dehydrogenase
MRQADCVTILTDHVMFDADEIVAHANLVVDTRNATGGRMPQVFRLGAPRPPPDLNEQTMPSRD